MNTQDAFCGEENQEIVRYLQEKYRFDDKVIKHSFNTLVAYEKWPPLRYRNKWGCIISKENEQLKNALAVIDQELNIYLFSNYSMLSSQNLTCRLSGN